jgi:hypothetical protein
LTWFSTTPDNSNATTLLPTGRANDNKSETEEDFMQWNESFSQSFTRTLATTNPRLTVEGKPLRSIDLHPGDPMAPKEM